MRLEKINLYSKNIFLSSQQKNRKSELPNYSINIETSIYNQKGLNVSFGCLAKGKDAVEESCIRLLRKVREGRRRKFAEDDIIEIVKDLRKIKKPKEKQNILEEILSIENENNGEKPDKNFIKQAIKLVTGKTESERYGILEFAQNDLKTTIKPLEAFSRLPEEKQNQLTKILKKIDDINEHKLFKSENEKNETVDSLYDLFRVALYADDDLSKMDISKADAYKISIIDLLNQDKKYFINLNGYSDPQAKSKVVSVTNNIFNYFLDNYIN